MGTNFWLIVYLASHINITNVLQKMHLNIYSLNKTCHFWKLDWQLNHAFIIYHTIQNWNWRSAKLPQVATQKSKYINVQHNYVLFTEQRREQMYPVKRLILYQEIDSLSRDIGLCDKPEEGEWCPTLSYLRCKGWQRRVHPLDVPPSWCYDEK